MSVRQKIKFYFAATFFLALCIFFVKPSLLEEDKVYTENVKVEKTPNTASKTIIEAESTPIKTRPTKKTFFALNENIFLQKDTSTIAGKWLTMTGQLKLLDDQGQEFDLTIDLSANGEGKKRISLNQDVACDSNVKVFFLADGRVSIRDTQQAKCSDQTVFTKSTILCSLDQDGQTKCLYEQENIKNRIPVIFYKEEALQEQ